jgi:hypothetical protein
MSSEIDTYFQEIAKIAENAIQKDAPQPRIPPVFDVPQDASATAWTALSVHPMSLLETEYVSIVQNAEKAAGNDQDLARDNGFEALSGFFALSSNSPSLLGQDALRLIDDRLKDLRARFEFADTLRSENQPEALEELTGVIGDAADAIAAVTDAQNLADAAAGFQAAAAYLGMFATDPDQVATRWADSHADQNQLDDYFAEVDTQLLRPLLSPANAVASPRSLYNIEPFFLYRLMHRFIGGDQVTPMDLLSKGIASGAATGAMHKPEWTWLTKWHEERVVELSSALKELDTLFKEKFDCQGDVIRFHLKGGRAMNTALGTPAKGSNDWDTGILINPDLTPEQWYEAFAKINDLVVAFLDHARFGYTALLNAHAAELGGVSAIMSTGAVGEPFDLDERPYSKLALFAEHHEASVGAGAVRRAPSALVADARQRLRSAGVNGELIDIGISKRASIELAEHWGDTMIVERQGAQVAGIPVPTLPYFVDDFSTIIREALADGTADRKLAKRLVRLNLVLGSSDTILSDAMAEAEAAATIALPRGAVAFGTGTVSSVERLKSWSLAGLLQSIPNAMYRPDWLASFDAYLSQQAESLLLRTNVASIWDQVKKDIDPANQNSCLGLLCVLNAAGTLSRQILADAVTLAKSIGGDDLPNAKYHAIVDLAIQSIMALSKPRSPNGFFYLSGGLAARMQAQHATVDSSDLLASCPDGIVEITYRLGNVSAKQALSSLGERLNMNLSLAQLKATVVENTAGIALVVKLGSPISNSIINVATPTVILVRPEQAEGEAARILDYVNGVPIVSTRDLTRFFRQRASRSHDFDLRRSLQSVAGFLLDRVLGRQLS